MTAKVNEFLGQFSGLPLHEWIELLEILEQRVQEALVAAHEDARPGK